MEPREPIRITRQGEHMKKPWQHSPKPTTNVASNERKDTRRVKSAIRVDDHKTIRDVRDWRDERKREGGMD